MDGSFTWTQEITFEISMLGKYGLNISYPEATHPAIAAGRASLRCSFCESYAIGFIMLHDLLRKLSPLRGFTSNDRIDLLQNYYQQNDFMRGKGYPHVFTGKCLYDQTEGLTI